MNQIQFITHSNDRYGYVAGARMALEGGCRWIQLRMKGATDEEVVETASQILPLCKQYGAVFLLDDRVHLVEQTQADGVHLGKDDMPISEARAALGEQYIIGGTANTIADIERIAQEGADYIGCGPFRFTTTKERLAPTLGLEGYRRLVAEMEARGITLPIVAIGGITYDDVPAIMQTGVDGIALSGAILNAADPVEEMRKFMEI